MPLNPKNFGMAGGIMFGLVMFLTTLFSIWTGYGKEFLNLMTSIYPGYSISWGGSIVGAIYGFIDCFVWLYLFGLLYNWLEGRK